MERVVCKDGSLAYPLPEFERPGDHTVPQYQRSRSTLKVVNDGPDVPGESK